MNKIVCLFVTLLFMIFSGFAQEPNLPNWLYRVDERRRVKFFNVVLFHGVLIKILVIMQRISWSMGKLTLTVKGLLMETFQMECGGLTHPTQKKFADTDNETDHSSVSISLGVASCCTSKNI